mmetsp:Transcript_59663/g.106050  ORF Transcript_59663/g.106050 Transcript_59663/m.106050 type:complete len:480 (-) Transcript_59663:68-1507(-)|eukprot:CAMPEP_0197637716 /NCGR_PEP_ID=MMETSP1338-20131121/12854_1 /TAXON_ID=43686 ORGANISM="Pelagodinium beii, Strain RCC1491" /NCGR_SAMPLE_ID=MMETSP1338 /ASSEMBLY_ACC=CAM_ASM_000754 /LENGTH=479 /DNA_ID=CAMNT_0043210169 /DNA_START=57 /DNA_END=1496 /DNA_ORIENTATION=-
MEAELDPLIQSHRVGRPSKIGCSVGLCLASSVVLGMVLRTALKAPSAPASSSLIALFGHLVPAISDSNGMMMMMDKDVNFSSLDKDQALKLERDTGWPPAALLHEGEDCWKPCNNISGDCEWCGAGNACCRYRAKSDPPECKGAVFTTYSHHTCVVPSESHAVKHHGQDCYFACSGKSGYCDWCGKGNACCRADIESDAAECAGAPRNSVSGKYQCTTTMGECPPGQIDDGYGGCKRPEVAPLMTFYMYKAVGPSGLQARRSTGMSSLTGLLWYLHNEIITHCPRKYGIDRIQRFLVKAKAPAKLYSTGYNFDSYVVFEHGKCQDKNCAAEHWDKYGYNIGCRDVDVDEQTASYPKPVWYSVPGSCPSKDDSSRTADCKAAQPGGQCDFPNGTETCTFSLQDAGQIFLDEISAIPDYNVFCANGNYEYDIVSDSGIGNSFWNSRLSRSACTKRISQVHHLFEKAYPNMPRSIGGSPCDH